MPDETRTPIDLYLQKEPQLQTPIAEFSKTKEELEVEWSKLVPLTQPKPGEQFAFKVDLDSCFGCKACVAACHSLNGLDEEESWRDVGFIEDSRSGTNFHRTVTSACHHCADPGCLNGCPVEAYEKDPVTGIVVHLDDQCIGCSYCILKCPYDVPKYNNRLGIVRKCDMCHERLTEGEAPACAQACPTQAISVTIVNTAEVLQEAEVEKFLPGAPAPSYTKPTTQYVSSREVPATSNAGDIDIPVKQHAHWPLIWMLVLTQLSAGLSIAFSASGFNHFSLLNISIGLATAGIISSVLHLGQPLRAWRVFLGLKSSWLSREILVFGVYLPLLGLSAFPQLFAVPYSTPIALATSVAGVIGVFTSVMIYADTKRSAWKLSRNLTRFYGTSILALFAGLGFVFESPIYAGLLLITSIGKNLWERFDLNDISANFPNIRRWNPLNSEKANLFRNNTWITPLLLIPVNIFPSSPYLWVFSLAVVFISEVIERYNFFTTVDVSKMPGGAAS